MRPSAQRRRVPYRLLARPPVDSKEALLRIRQLTEGFSSAELEGFRHPWEEDLPFDRIRVHFFRRYHWYLRKCIQEPFWLEPAGLSQARKKLFVQMYGKSPKKRVLPALHGTLHRNYPSILEVGLRIGGEGEVARANGSFDGKGIYMATPEALWLSKNFTDTNAVLLCGIIDEGDPLSETKAVAATARQCADASWPTYHKISRQSKRPLEKTAKLDKDKGPRSGRWSAQRWDVKSHKIRQCRDAFVTSDENIVAPLFVMHLETPPPEAMKIAGGEELYEDDSVLPGLRMMSHLVILHSGHQKSSSTSACRGSSRQPGKAQSKWLRRKNQEKSAIREITGDGEPASSGGGEGVLHYSNRSPESPTPFGHGIANFEAAKFSLFGENGTAGVGGIAERRSACTVWLPPLPDRRFGKYAIRLKRKMVKKTAKRQRRLETLQKVGASCDELWRFSDYEDEKHDCM